MTAQTCPHCGTVNPEDAVTCDCGYDLVARRMDAPRRRAGSGILKKVLAIGCLGIVAAIGLVVWRLGVVGDRLSRASRHQAYMIHSALRPGMTVADAVHAAAGAMTRNVYITCQDENGALVMSANASKPDHYYFAGSSLEGWRGSDPAAFLAALRADPILEKCRRLEISAGIRKMFADASGGRITAVAPLPER
jgi:hypothetical protein